MLNNPSCRRQQLELSLEDSNRIIVNDESTLLEPNRSEKANASLARCLFHYCIIAARNAYSLGMGKSVIESYIIRACNIYSQGEVLINTKKVLGLSSYECHLSLFCYAYLFNIDDTYWNKIVTHWLSLNLEDSLIMAIIAKRNPEYAQKALNCKLQQEKWFVHATAAIFATTPETQLAELKAHLFRWYTSRKLCGWYDSHKSKQPCYSGYWSIESAAIVKACNLDVDLISLGRYFPAGLLDPTGNPQRCRVFYPHQDELCFIVSRDWKDESQERLNLLSPNGLLEVAGTLYEKGNKKLPDFISARHESTLKNLPWYSLIGKPSKVKTSIRIAEKYVYQGQWPDEGHTTTSEHYFLGIGQHFLAISFTYLTFNYSQIEDYIHEVLQGLEV